MPLPFLNKKGDAEPVAAPMWHPNFRNFERLPDTKVVRTTFFINVAAVAAALLMAAFVGWREYQAHLFNMQTAAAEALIAKDQKQSNDGLRLTKIFTDEDKKIAEVTTFLESRIDTSEILVVLGQSLPKDIQLDFVDYRPNDANNPARCVLRGLAAGTKDQASGAASAYVETLRTQPRLSQVFDAVKLNAINLDPKSGALIFEIELKFKSVKGAKKS